MQIQKGLPERLYLLSHLLRAPESDALDVLGELSKMWPWLAESFKQVCSLSLEIWQAEHTRLFISNFPRTVCPPFASAYTNECIDGSLVVKLLHFYDSIGLESTLGFEDFLGTMFECTAYLINKKKEIQLQWFFVHHLEPWVPRFTADLLQGARMQLYRDMAIQINTLFLPALFP